MLKKLIKISYIISATLIGVVMLLYLLFNSFIFQNYLIGRVTRYLNETYKTNISIGEINYDGWTYFSLRRVKWGDQKNDTTFYAGRLQFNIVGVKLDSTHFVLNDVVLDEGLCKFTTYKDGTNSMNVVDLFSDPNDTLVDPNAPPFILEFKNLECLDSRFMYVDSTLAFTDQGFDYNRIYFYETNFRSKLFQIIDDSLSFDLRNMSTKERCGFEITRMKAQATVCNTTINLANLDLVTPNSHIKNSFGMHARSWDDYSDFNNKVMLKSNLLQSEIDMKDIAYFIPGFEEYKYKAKISAVIKGPLANLNIKNVVASMGKDTKFSGRLTMKGLPNIEETFMDIQVDYATSVKKDLEQIIAMELPKQMGDLGKITYKGNYTGFISDFVSYGSIETAFGSAETDLNMKLNEKTKLTEYSGFLKMNHFQLGAFLKNNDFGVIDLTAKVEGKGFDLATLDTKFSGRVDALGYNNYVYRNIEVLGSVRKKNMIVTANIADSNIQMNADIQADLSKEYTHFVVKGNLENINLKPLHIMNEKIAMGTLFDADYYYKDLNDHYGTMKVEDFHYDKAGYNYRVNLLSLETQNDEEESILINGDFIKGKLRGQFDFAQLYNQLKYWTLSLGDPFFHPQIVKNTFQHFDFTLNLNSTSNISPLLFPGLNLSNVDLEGKVNSENQSYEIAGYIGNLNYENWQLNHTTFKLDESEKSKAELILGFRGLLKSDTLLLGEFALKAEGEMGHFDLQYQIEDSLSIVQGKFQHDLLFAKDSIDVSYKPTWVQSGNSRWNVEEAKTIHFNNERVQFNKFSLGNGNEKITIDGFYDYDGKNKSISAKIENVRLNAINQFVRSAGVNMGGLANGYIVYKNMGIRDVVIAKLNTTHLSLDQDTLGDFNLDISYREKEEDLLIAFSSLSGKINNLKGSGNYVIASRFLDLNIVFSESQINAFQAFVKNYVKLNGGEASLNAKLSGPIGKLTLNGQLELKNVNFKVEYLQTNYTINQARINFDDNEIIIVPFDLKDAGNQIAHVSGQVKHEGFSHLKYDILVDDFKSFQVMNTKATDNDLFYGTAYASGKFTMKGSSNDIAMYIDVQSEKGTKVLINPFGVSNETGESYIHYVSHDTLQTFKGKGKGVDFGMGVYMNIKATDAAEIQVIFDARSDDRIKAKGTGILRMEYLPNGSFNMYGQYALKEGEYRFSAMNVVAKKFDLKQGSIITWAGDPLQGVMDISGIYKLKTSISPIVNMSKAPDPNVRIPVECIIHIRGIVERPEFSFDLNFPDFQNNLTGTTASELNAVVSNFRREPEMMNQQILFLLISGSFVPITNTNNTANNSFGTQTVSDLLSKQAASLIGKAVPGVDVSVDLLNASDPTKSRTFLLSASKRYLDNRLEIQTSYAFDQTQTNLSAIYNLKKNGNTKLKIFNKSGFNALYNKNVITSGAGLYYRKEFNQFSELFKKQNTITQ